MTEKYTKMVEEHNKQKQDVVPKKKDSDLDKDYQYTKKKIKQIIEMTEPVLEHACDLALEGEGPRQVEVVASLAKNLGELAKAVMENNKVRKEIDGPKVDENPKSQLTQNNAIFVGSTKDLLEKVLKSEEEKDVIEMKKD